MTILAFIALFCAAVPCLLFFRNLRLYALPGAADGAEGSAVSVLIPARNEAANIGAVIESVLRNRGVTFEIVVLDDHSSDDTAAIVEEIAQYDSRVRLERSPALPAGWCGKQHACWTLS